MGDTEKIEIPITKLQWGFRGTQVFFAFLAMATIAAVISFDNKYVSSKILDNLYLFILLISMFVAGAIVGIPYVYLQYGKLKPMARALRHLRVEFVLSAIWAFLLFIVTLGVTIEIAFRKCAPSDYSEEFLNYTAGNKTNGEHLFEKGLKGACTTQRASIAFGWFALASWIGSMLLITKGWYDNRRQPVKHDYHPHEVTMHSNSTRSSLEESGLPHYPEVGQQQQPAAAAPPQSQPEPPPSSPPIYPVAFQSPPPQHQSQPYGVTPPPSNIASIQIPASQIQIPPGSIPFPEPKHY
ncbi:6204_t:CDS:1 [Ambispora leptoticha]|uniref:6204_t:CDS:1 n=1 Tax=Ambispora leptoticha TaxID=144679 RepID=A0A9N9BNR1_9GLOM|nr:6204_t:CDS:1 [Ambispora leptoticha]